MIPQLRFPKFTDEWQVKKLGDITKIFDGTHQTPKYVEAGVPFFSVEHVTANDFSNTKFISEEVFQKEKNKPERGDILMTRIGDIGTARYVNWDTRASFYVSLALIKGSNEYDGTFLEKYIATSQFQNELWRRTLHVAFPKKINLGDISQCQIKLPSNPEQEKIADFLTAVDERIAVGEKKLELLETYKRGVMQKIFSQRVRFKDENGNPYPDWEEKKLGEISVIKTGKKDANIAKSDGEYRFYTCSRDYLHTDVYSFEGEAILVAGNADVGLCHYYNGKFEAYQRTYVLQNFKTDGKYLYKYLSHFFRQYALGLMQSSAMTYITLGTLENFTVPLPSEEEQQKIATFLATLDDKITAEKSKLTAARQFKKALLQRMFV